MYYYIFEQPRNSNDRKIHDKVRVALEESNIYGENCVASPARSADELTEMGFNKGATTIVAVGSDRHINKIVNTIKLLERGLNRNVVLGVIPVDPDSTIKERLRLGTIEDACDALKKRRYTTVTLGYIEGVRYFLTTAEIHCGAPVKISIRADRWQSSHEITDLVIFSDLTFSFYNSLSHKKGVSKLLAWMTGSQSGAEEISIFHGRTLQISSGVILPVTIEGEPVTKTPFIVYKMPKALKVIIKRDKFISSENNEEKALNNLG